MSKIMLSIPEKFLEDIDTFAKEEERTRSELIREALRLYMRQKKLLYRALDVKNSRGSNE